MKTVKCIWQIKCYTIFVLLHRSLCLFLNSFHFSVLWWRYASPMTVSSQGHNEVGALLEPQGWFEAQEICRKREAVLA